MVTLNDVKPLLSQPENATLEFKRKPYNLDDYDLEAKKLQRGELIKDILALANGSPTTVGDKAYLIIGADDKLQADGSRKLFDVPPDSLTTQRILHLVNAACQPRLQNIDCESLEIEGKRLLVITIWPTPYLHETIRDLTTSQGSFTKYTVFTRHDANIEVASQREREVILKLKQFHQADTRKAPPAKFGAFVGAVVGGAIAAAPLDKTVKPKKAVTIGRSIGGAVGGMLFGTGIGWTFTNFADIRYDWYFTSKLGRFVWVVTFIGLLGAAWSLLKWLRQSFPNLFARPGRRFLTRELEK